MFENPRSGRQARNFTTNVPKILDLKSSSEQIFSENCRWVPLNKLNVVLEKFSFDLKVLKTIGPEGSLRGRRLPTRQSNNFTRRSVHLKKFRQRSQVTGLV